MALSYSPAVNNARLDAIETTVGASAMLKLYSGAAPAIGAAATGTLLADIALPSDWMAAAASAQKLKAGTWSGTAINGPGTIGYFRITNTAGTAVGIQGSCGMSSADMIVDNTSVQTGQTITVNTFQINAANA